MARSASALPVHAAAGRTLRRAEVLRRGLGGGVALVASGAALGALAAPAAAAVPDVDLSYLRVLIGAELLKGDFQARRSRAASSTRPPRGSYGGCRPTTSALRRARCAADRRRADGGDRRGHRLLLPARRASARASILTLAWKLATLTPRRVPRRDRERPDAGTAAARSRRSRRTRRSRSSALAPFARRPAGRQRVRGVAPDRRRLHRARRVRELTMPKQHVHGERGGVRARDQPRHAEALGQGRADRGRTRRGQPPRRAGLRDRPAARRRRRARTSAPATTFRHRHRGARSTG